jgi:rhamnose transport system ATP-binding protein
VSGLEFRDVAKSFGAVRALRGVSFAVNAGEAHALVGENGAGKSTLMKILAGIERPDAGAVLWDGAPLDLATPRHALDRGIGMVYQETVLFPNLTVTENIFAGREPTGFAGRLRQGEMRARTLALLQDLGLPLSPDVEAESLNAAERQFLQIARALAFECRMLILDEPTTCLTDAESAELFVILDRLKGAGLTLIYVSHKLPEIFRLCDRITVLRDGAHVMTQARAQMTPRDVVRSMVGRDLEVPKRSREALAAIERETPLFSVAGLTRRPFFENVSFAVRPGEILGMFGLVGSGRSEVAETLFGLHGADAGRVSLAGSPFEAEDPMAAVRAGLALVPEDRQRQGLFFNLDVGQNLAVTRELAAPHHLIDARAEAASGAALLGDFHIKTAGLHASPDSLSGGNQQKVLLARWLSTAPRLLILDEPTKGVDIGAKYEIHERIRHEAARGMGTLLISSDLPEVLVLADRILVMREGRVRGTLTGSEAGEEPVMRLATTVVH